MSETAIPGAEELQKRLREFLQSTMGAAAAPSPDGVGAATAPECPADFTFNLTPAEIKAHLDRFVIKQDEAKKVLSIAVCDHYNHAKYLAQRAVQGETSPVEYNKQNVIITGPTGVGKTYLVRHIAELIGVPFVKADATKFSETGYVGGDVEDLVRELVQKAGGDVNLAEHGIIYIDEIDKIATSGSMIGRDVSGRGVQTALLKLMEETEVAQRNPMDMAGQMQAMLEVQRGGSGGRSTVNTRSILFIVSGAFPRLREIVAKRRRQAQIGFAAPVESGPERAWQQEVTTADFVEYGLEAEFVGRLPVRVACEELEASDLRRILTDSEGSVLRQYERSFQAYGIEAVFRDEALGVIAERAAAEGTGARGLLTVCERILRDCKFELPGSGVKELIVDTALIERPAERLAELLAGVRGRETLVLRETAEEFFARLGNGAGLEVKADPALLDALVKMAEEKGQPMRELCGSLFGDYEFGLRLLKTGGPVVLTLEALRAPDKFLSDLVVSGYRGQSNDESSTRSAS
jgi:ATP-dependent Clp protease ATP-binding subunit ClpX